MWYSVAYILQNYPILIYKGFVIGGVGLNGLKERGIEGQRSEGQRSESWEQDNPKTDTAAPIARVEPKAAGAAREPLIVEEGVRTTESNVPLSKRTLEEKTKTSPPSPD